MSKKDQSIYEVLEDILKGVIDAPFEFIGSLFSKQKTDYTAAFTPIAEVLSRNGKGFAIGGSHALSALQSHANMATFAKTGAGKSSCISIPSAYTLSRGGASLFFMDPSMEIFNKTSGYLSSIGYKILKLDFSDQNSSQAFNGMHNITSVSGCQRLSHMLIKTSNVESQNDKFWSISAEMILNIFIRLLVFHTDEKYRNLTNVLRLIEAFSVDPHNTTDRLFAKIGDESLLLAYQGVIKMPSTTQQSVLATLKAALKIFTDPKVSLLTSHNTISFKDARRERIAIYFTCPVSQLSYFSSLASLFYNTAFGEVLAQLPVKEERDIFFILDEAGILKFGSDFSSTIANVRKYRCGILLCVQDISAWKNLYGNDSQNIKNNTGTQVYLKHQPIETIRDLNELLGKYSYRMDGVLRTRELLSVDELRATEDAIILIDGKVVKANLKPYYSIPQFKRFSEMPPYQETNQFSYETPPLIPFE